MLNISIKRSSLPQLLFDGVVVYYWMLLYLIQPDTPPQRMSFLYLALVIPVLAYILLNAGALLRGSWKKRNLWLLLYIAAVCTVSVLRSDASTIYNCLIYTLPLIIFLNAEVRINIRLINILFLLSVFMSVVFKHLGLSIWNYLPDFFTPYDMSKGDVGWRISLFPGIPESGFFSLFVFILNFYYHSGPARFPVMAASFYFFAFSGSRTGLILFGFFILFVLVGMLLRFRMNLFYKSFVLICLLVFVAAMNRNSVLNLLRSPGQGFMNELVYKTGKQPGAGQYTEGVNSRSWIWQQHLRIFRSNPYTGSGTFNFEDHKVKSRQFVQYQMSTGSESLLTAWLARVGLLMIPFLLYLFAAHWHSARMRCRFPYFMVLLILITMLSYGSFLVPYGFMFFVLFGSLNGVLEQSYINFTVDAA